jgi:hypothetical protein
VFIICFLSNLDQEGIDMSESYQFHDEYTLAETAEELGKKALSLGLVFWCAIFLIADNTISPTKKNLNL